MTTAISRPPLVRSSDRVIAGVCAGLAAHLGWPVRMVRIGMVVAALAGGAGLAFYAWLWIMVPTADENAKRNARRPASPIAPAVSAPGPLPVAGPDLSRPRTDPPQPPFPAGVALPGGTRQALPAGTSVPACRGGRPGAGLRRQPAAGPAAAPTRRRPVRRGSASGACRTARKSCWAPACCWQVES